MESETLGPDANHTPKWDEDCHDVGDDELKKISEKFVVLKR